MSIRTTPRAARVDAVQRAPSLRHSAPRSAPPATQALTRTPPDNRSVCPVEWGRLRKAWARQPATRARPETTRPSPTPSPAARVATARTRRAARPFAPSVPPASSRTPRNRQRAGYVRQAPTRCRGRAPAHLARREATKTRRGCLRARPVQAAHGCPRAARRRVPSALPARPPRRSGRALTLVSRVRPTPPATPVARAAWTVHPERCLTTARAFRAPRARSGRVRASASRAPTAPTHRCLAPPRVRAAGRAPSLRAA